MDHVERVHVLGLSNIHSFVHNISLIRLFSLIFNYAKTPIDFMQPKNMNIYYLFHVSCKMCLNLKRQFIKFFFQFKNLGKFGSCLMKDCLK